ncbi:MAG TPA: M20/M25/M40 family metallo-hydrolase [Steroidobacteraceae bacterium]|jgi:acetylornithine deacetylase/succinyl-diaminopimelate desuccinylase-like protein
MINRTTLALFLTLFTCLSAHAAPMSPGAAHALAHDIFKQLIEIDTSEAGLGSTPAAEAAAQRLRDAGFDPADIQVLGPNDRKKNVVVRLRGTGKKKPMLLIGHLDVVDALRSDWTTNPYEFVEKDGYVYGRGTQDMKDGDTIMLTTLIRYKQEGLRLDRDIILALTADEESGSSNGVEWLLKNHRDLVDAEFVLNHDGGGVTLENGKPTQIEVTATEKVYADFSFGTKNPGGHSSLPTKTNAIYALSAALQRVAQYDFPFELNNVTRPYYEQVAAKADPTRAADIRAMLQTPPDAAAIARLSSRPIDNSTIRTTCVATRLEGGHANNALPQSARANVNCRILPGHSPEEVRQQLIKVVNDPTVTVQYVATDGTLADIAPDVRTLAPPPPREDVLKPLQRIASKMWPTATLVTSMAVGASDGVYTGAAGLPTYLVGGEAIELSDIRAHGKDERIPLASFYRAVDFYYDYLKAVASYKK